MNKIIKGRGMGKTYDLIKLSAKKQMPILVVDEARTRHIKSRAKDMGANIPNPVALTHFGPFSPIGIKRPVLIDDAEIVLRRLLNDNYGVSVDTITISSPKQFTKEEIAKKIGIPADEFEVID